MTSERPVPPLRVGIVGLGWMGQVHARSHRRLGQHYPDLPLDPVLVAVADNAPDDRLARARQAYGFAHVYDDWRALVARDDLDLISVTGPNSIHREVGVAVAESGRHLWIEKPAGRDAAETEAIAAAVRSAGVQSAAGFNYRNAPAVELARDLIAAGRLGAVEHVEIGFLADYSADPAGPLSWRFRVDQAGSGVLGDLVSHGIDLAGHLLGDRVAEVVCDLATFVPERPEAVGVSTGHAHRGTGGTLLPVQNEDYAAALLRFAGGARGSLTSSRVAVGEQCSYTVTVHGTRGAVRWDFRRMGELQTCLDQPPTDAAWQTRLVGPGDAELGAFQPGAGIAMSYDDLKVIEAHRLVTSIATGRPVGATVEDAARAARVVEALQTSARDRRWVTVRS